jgi:hypothetical protein
MASKYLPAGVWRKIARARGRNPVSAGRGRSRLAGCAGRGLGPASPEEMRWGV